MQHHTTMNSESVLPAAADSRCRGGFTLLEMITVMALLAVVMGLIVSTLWGAVRVERVDAAASRQLLRRSYLADQFRADVSRATDVPASLGRYEAGPTCLILKMSAAQSVVYSWDTGGMIRLERTDGKQTRQVFPLGDENVWVRFGPHAAADRVVWMELTVSVGKGTSRQERRLQIAAALGGDVR